MSRNKKWHDLVVRSPREERVDLQELLDIIIQIVSYLVRLTHSSICPPEYS